MLDLSLSISPEPHLEQQQQQQQQPPPRRDVEYDHWTKYQKRNFKRALSEFSTDIPNFFEKIASKVPGKSIEQVQKYFESCYKLDGNMHVLVNEDDDLVLPSMLPGRYANRKRACYWTQNEHELFLMGVAKYGMGMWKQIAENYVRSKTAIEVLNHAQNFFSRADKKRLRAIDLFKNTDDRTITATVTTTVAAVTTNNYAASTSKSEVSDGHDGDGDDDDDDVIIVLDSAPNLPLPRRVPQTLNLFPLATLASSSQEEEDEEDDDEEEKGSTLNLFPTHPTYI